MKKLKLIGSAAAIGLLLAACGSDKNPAANKLQTQPGTTESQPTSPTTTPVASRRMELDPMLVELLKRQDKNFDPSLNCFTLQGNEVQISSQGCELGKGQQQQGQQAKPSSFVLSVEELKQEKPQGQKGQVTPPTEGKPTQGQVVPAPRLFYLVLKGKQTQGKGKQQVTTIPDTRVGEFVIEHLPVAEEMTEGKPSQQLPTEIAVEGKPGQVTPPTQGKPPVVVPPQPQKPGQVTPPVQPPTQGKPPVVVPPQPQKPGQVTPPTQGKPPVVVPPQPQKPTQGKQSGPKLNLREAVVLTKLCTDEYFNVCALIFNQGHITGLKLLKEEFQVGGEELAQQSPSQKGKETPVTPAPKQGQKEVPVAGKPAPGQQQPSQEKPIGQKPTPQQPIGQQKPTPQQPITQKPTPQQPIGQKPAPQQGKTQEKPLEGKKPS